jgi:hypothetical protein
MFAGDLAVVTGSRNGVGILKNRFNVYIYKCTSSQWAGSLRAIRVLSSLRKIIAAGLAANSRGRLSTVKTPRNLYGFKFALRLPAH